MKAKTIVLSILLMTGVNTHAQKRFTLNVGTSIPTSDFGKYVANGYYIHDYTYGYASIGLKAGFQYVQPISTIGLGIYGSIDVMRNGLKKKFKDAYEENINPETKIKHASYWNFPISVGLHYQKGTSDEKLAFYASAGIVANILTISKYRSQTSSFTHEYTYSPSIHVGFKTELGMVFNDKLSVGITYYGLGDHSFDYTSSGSGSYTSYTYAHHKKISMIALSLGLKI